MTTQTVSAPDRAVAALNAELRRQGGRPVRGGAERLWLDLEYDETTFDAYDTALALVRFRRSADRIEPDAVPLQMSPELAAFTWSRSLLRAQEAGDEPTVQAFRRDVLDGQLLSRDQVQRWVEQQAEVDGPATVYVLVKVAQSWTRGDSLDEATERQLSVESLEFPGDDGWVHHVSVAAEGVLGRLRVVAEHLAGQYGWQRAQSTAFVLTGSTPFVPMLRTTVTVVGTNPKVLLEVDPDVPAEVVAAAHTQARRELLGPKPRTPSARAVELVQFAAEHPTMTVAQLWMRWNRGLGEANQYDDVRAFRRALKDARRRVDGQPRRAR